MPANRKPHTVNGRFFGVWYETAAGKRMYLAHRKAEDVYRLRHAWCIDVATLERARSDGVYAIGVVRRSGKDRLVWLTHVDDFFDSPHSFSHFGTSRQRGLPLSRFRIDPAKSAKFIESAVKMR
jgi:hypothetical protein